MVRVEVEVLCPNCSAWYKLGFAELNRETLELLRRLLNGVRFEPILGLQPVIQTLGEAVKIEEVN